ncbi:MAG: hypothetical protein K2K97_08835 [Muribaculaceae bacterium]|nr:hypothetical protein [Muribaculaceae bacterium]
MVEAASTVGLLLIAVGLVAPFAALGSDWVPVVCRWVYAAGALLYTAARMVNVNEPNDSSRLRRLRRMEMWAGFCFVIGGAFWFYNAHRFAGISFSLPVMRDTIAFTMAGAIIQIVASWMISARAAKEKKSKD